MLTSELTAKIRTFWRQFSARFEYISPAFPLTHISLALCVRGDGPTEQTYFQIFEIILVTMSSFAAQLSDIKISHIAGTHGYYRTQVCLTCFIKTNFKRINFVKDKNTGMQFQLIILRPLNLKRSPLTPWGPPWGPLWGPLWPPKISFNSFSPSRPT